MADTPRHIFLAPHYDDVALSCGGTVAALAESDQKGLIVTVFGGAPRGSLTEFASDMHQRWGVGPGDAVAVRRREEACAGKALGAEAIWLDFLDAIYRDARYTSDPDIFGAIHPDEAGFGAEILAALTERLELSSHTPDVFYVPLAVGNHVDHQHMYAAGKRLASLGHTVWAYEDFPYAGDPQWRDSILDLASRLTTGESRLNQLTQSQLQSRIDAVLCYASQLDVIFRYQGDPRVAVGRYARAVGDGQPAERFWRL